MRNLRTFALVALAIIAAFTAVVFVLALVLPAYIWDPLGYCPASLGRQAQLGCKGYNIWSGILGSFLTSSPGWVIAVCMYYLHHNCRKPGCPKLGHPHPDHGKPVCSTHHYYDPVSA